MNKLHPLIGYYTSADQPIDQPTYDPPHDGPCLICWTPIPEGDIRTHGVMWLDRNPAISAYFRTHRTCAEATNMDPYCESVLDALRSAPGLAAA
jgi:hypothetical protein